MPAITVPFTSATNGGPVPMVGPFNFTVSGTFVGTIQLQRSFDGGVTWIPLCLDVYGTQANFTTPITMMLWEPEAGVLYRSVCTSFTSGTATARISQ